MSRDKHNDQKALSLIFISSFYNSTVQYLDHRFRISKKHFPFQ